MVFSCISKYVNLLFCWNIYTPLFITSFDTSTGGIRKLATGGIVVWTIKEELFTRFSHLNWPVENSISCSFKTLYLVHLSLLIFCYRLLATSAFCLHTCRLNIQEFPCTVIYVKLYISLYGFVDLLL